MKGMSAKRWVITCIMGAIAGWGTAAQAKDIKITLPRRSHMTPVQKLNQRGVEAVRKHHYEKAQSLFYKAYLLDPEDPFTLNNLGYISEMQGQVDRAENFYSLAGEEPTEAVIARASSKSVEGRPVKEALAIQDEPLKINHDNVEAVRLLRQGRAPEADLLLERVLKSDPKNIFTLNNLGVAKEMEGESEAALHYYDAAAAANSDATAVVTLSVAARGEAVNRLAAENAEKLRRRLATETSPEIQVAELNIRGVSALNRNDLKAADEDFRKAYALDPNNAFAVNNYGYLSEIEGDQESAEFFYERAQTMTGANRPVGLATRKGAEGTALVQVAAQNDSKVETVVDRERELRRLRREPILLQRRDNSVVQEPGPPTER
jgi:Flp pilus assembly protein TadD